MNEKKLGLILGSFFGLMHLLWSILIALGFAQSFLNFVFNMHSLNNPYMVMPFDLMRSIGLIIITSVVGYIVGNILAMIWNKFHK